jgi:type IV secretion system protein TrbL
MNPGIFVQLLHALQGALEPGMGALRPYILGLFAFLAFLEMTRLALGMMLGTGDLARTALRFFLRTGTLLWVLLDYPLAVNLIYRSFVQLGLIAGGNALTVPQFLDPGTYLAVGIRVGDVLYQALLTNLGLTTIPLAFAYFFAWVCFVVAYGIMGVSVFILQVELTLTVMASLVMLPFAALHGTGWIAQGAISYPINVGFRFFVLALLASVVFPLLSQLTAPQATLQTALVMVLAAWVMAFLFLKGPAIAAGILSGTPSLSAGQVMQAAAGTAIAGGAALTLGGAAAAVGARGALAATGTLTKGLSAAGTAYSIGSATTVGGSMAQVAGGVRGLATAGAKALGSGVQSLGSSSADRLRQTLQAGRRAGWVQTGGTLPPRADQPQRTAPRPTVGNALLDTLGKSSRYFSQDGASGGTRADLD